MGQAQDTMYTEYPIVIRDVTASQFAAQAVGKPAHPGVRYRVDGNAEYQWDGSAWVAVVSSKTNPVTGGIRLQAGDTIIPINNNSARVGYEGEQPAEIICAVTRYGKLACRFGSGQWSVAAGAPTLAQGHTGWNGSGVKNGIVSRTGMPDMLKVVPAGNTAEEIQLGTFGTNFLTPSLAGKIGLWVYVESQPGYQAGGTVVGSINVTLSTNAASSANALNVSWNTNQVREGWNFLKFVQRDPEAYAQGSGVTEYHPFGVTATGYGTGADANITTGTLARIKVGWQNMQGATLYFDSIWTDFASTPQVVLGCDGGVNLAEIALPVFQRYGWAGYVALPFSTADSGTSNNTLQADLMSNALASAAATYAAGWDVINHSVTHPSLGGYTSEAGIAYQLDQARGWLMEMGYIRGAEFYASPQSSSSRLSEAVIKTLGYKLQRHVRKWNTSVTPWGIDNPHHVGSFDMGSAGQTGVSSATGGSSGSIAGWQTATKIKRAIDVTVAYGDTCFPFWHGITTTGDTGSGEDLTGDNLLLTRSAFEQSMAYIRQLEQAGSLRVCRGISGFWYGG